MKLFGLIGIQKVKGFGATWLGGKLYRTKEEAMKMAKEMQDAINKGGKTKMKIKVSAAELDEKK